MMGPIAVAYRWLVARSASGWARVFVSVHAGGLARAMMTHARTHARTRTHARACADRTRCGAGCFRSDDSRLTQPRTSVLTGSLGPAAHGRTGANAAVLRRRRVERCRPRRVAIRCSAAGWTALRERLPTVTAGRFSTRAGLPPVGGPSALASPRIPVCGRTAARVGVGAGGRTRLTGSSTQERPLLLPRAY